MNHIMANAISKAARTPSTCQSRSNDSIEGGGVIGGGTRYYKEGARHHKVMLAYLCGVFMALVGESVTTGTGEHDGACACHLTLRQVSKALLFPLVAGQSLSMVLTAFP